MLVGAVFMSGPILAAAHSVRNSDSDSCPDRVSVMRISAEKPRTVLRVPLPPSAVITRTEDGSNVWRQLGHVPANFTAVEQSFHARLYGAGWLSVMRVPVRAVSPRNEIYVWQRDDMRIMLMLWEEDVNRTGFSWGVDSGEVAKTSFVSK